MNKGLKEAIKEIAEEHDFVWAKGSCFRIANDVVQGFSLRERKSHTFLRATVEFAIYPLCNPDANFYRFSFAKEDLFCIGGEKYLLPFECDLTSEDSKKKYLSKISDCLIEVLVPYLDTYSSCDVCSSPEFIEQKIFNGATMDSAFFLIKAGHRIQAILGLKQLQTQNSKKLKEALQHSINPMSQTQVDLREKKLVQLSTQIAFFEHASDDELKSYLSNNEKRAIAFLRQTCF